MSAGVWTMPASTSWSTSLSPRPSMSSARRLAKCSSACLRCAGQTRPPVQRAIDLVGQPHDGRAAFRTARRHDEHARVARPLVEHHADDLRDHVARAAHDDGVADAHVAPADLVLVVQRHVGHRRAADEHRLEARDRRDRAGATDLHVDGEQPRGHLLRRKLVRDRPARLARPEAERALQFEAVDLVDDAVDLERQLAAPRLRTSS